MQEEQQFDRSSVIRAIILLTIISAGIFFCYYTDYSQNLTKEYISDSIESIRKLISGYGFYGNVLFVIVAICAIVINIPSVVIILFSVIIFGGIKAAIVSAISIYIAAMTIYVIAQYLGRGFLKRLCGSKLDQFDKKLEHRGFKTVLYLRLLFFMLPPFNWMLSLSNIGFRDFLLGTVLGTFHHIIVLTWLSDNIIEAVKAGESLNPIKNPGMMASMAIGFGIIISIRLIGGCISNRKQNPYQPS